jgi:hypothetical protein
MRRTLRVSILILLLGFLVIDQAEARGGGGGGAVGGHAGGSSGPHGGGFRGGPRAVVVFNNRGGRVVNLNSAKLARGEAFGLRQSLIRNRFRNGIPVGWPIGDWWPGYGYQPVQQTDEGPAQPEIFIIHTDGQGRTETAEAAADLSYVKGCHAVPNGYHCDLPDEGH